MKTGQFFIITGLIFALSCKDTKVRHVDMPAEASTLQEIKPLLKHPFGTLLTLSAIILDGDSLPSKGLSGSFVLLVKKINDKPVTDSIILEYKDETGKFPNDVIGLSKLLVGNDEGRSSLAADSIMKQQYVGKTITVVAYESGGFTGIPDGYFDYQEVRQDVGFGFKNYLVLVADKNGHSKTGK